MEALLQLLSAISLNLIITDIIVSQMHTRNGLPVFPCQTNSCVVLVVSHKVVQIAYVNVQCVCPLIVSWKLLAGP